MKQTYIFYQKWRYAEQHAILKELSPSATRAYLEILNRDGMGWSLPSEPQRLAAVLGVHADAVNEVLERFAHLFIVERGELHHRDVTDARLRAEALSRKRAAAGTRGAAARWQTDADGNCHDKSHDNCYGKPDGKLLSDVTYTEAPDGLKTKRRMANAIGDGGAS